MNGMDDRLEALVREVFGMAGRYIFDKDSGISMSSRVAAAAALKATTMIQALRTCDPQPEESSVEDAVEEIEEAMAWLTEVAGDAIDAERLSAALHMRGMAESLGSILSILVSEPRKNFD